MKPDLKYLVLLLFLFGSLIRLYYFAYPFGRSSEVTVDEAVYGLQSIKILEGQRPIFYPAQDYTGSFSAYLSAFIFYIFGVSSFSLKVIPLLFSLGTLATIYLIARKIFGSNVGVFALFFSALGTPFWNNWSSRAGTGYVEATFLGTLILLLTMSLAKNSEDLRGRWYGPVGLGFLSGLGFWIQPTIVYFVVPSLLFLLFNLRKKFLLVFVLFVLGFLVGAGPVVYYNTSLKPSATALALLKKPWGVRGALVNLTFEGLPVLLGGRTANSQTDFNPVSSTAVYLLFFLALVYFTKIVFDSRRSRPEALLVYFFLISTVGIFLISTPFNQLSIEPRYVYSLYVVIPVILARFADRILKSSKSFLVLLVFFYLTNFFIGLFRAGPLTFLDSYKFDSLVSFFHQQKIDYAITSPSAGHRLSFFSGGQIKIAVRGGGITEARFEKDNQAVTRIMDNDPRLGAYVVRVGESETSGFKNEALRQFGKFFAEAQVLGGFNIFYAINSKLGL